MLNQLLQFIKAVRLKQGEQCVGGVLVACFVCRQLKRTSISIRCLQSPDPTAAVQSIAFPGLNTKISDVQ